MRSLLLAAALLSVAGCDSYGVEGICLIGDQPALYRNTVEADLLSPATGDTLRLGETFALRGRVDAVGPDIVQADARLQVLRLTRGGSILDADTLLAIPLGRADGAASFRIDTTFTIGRLRGGLTSRDLGPNEDLYVTLGGDAEYPVESEGPGCGTVDTGTGATTFSLVTILNARPTD